MTIRDTMWLWGQTANSHHAAGNPFKLPGKNMMTPKEGGTYFGINNMCRVVMADMPTPPFDEEAAELTDFHKVVWSVIGSGGSKNEYMIDEIIRLAKLYPNVVGGIMDDFMNESRMELFKPQVVQELRDRLHTEAGRFLDLWTVIYTQELTEERRPYIAACDKLTMWTWWGEFYKNLDENLAKLRYLSNGQEIYAGCYLYDYGNRCQLPDEVMQLQLDTYYRWLKNGDISGIIVCSNCVADLGFHAVDVFKKWMDCHADEVLDSLKTKERYA